MPAYSMGNSNNVTVHTELGDVVVHKMPLIDYAELLRALDKLPAQFVKAAENKELDFNASNASIFQQIIPFIADAWPDFVALIAVPTDKDAEFLAKLDGADSIEIILAIAETNDFERIISSVKKLKALKAKKPALENAENPPASN